MRKIALRILACALFLALQLSPALAQENTAQKELAFNTTLLCELPADGHYRILQGGCVSEDYAWFIQVSANDYRDDYNKLSRVVKYERETMREICHSAPLSMGHANDAAYMPQTNELYVIQVWSGRITVLDADTLEEKRVVRLRGTLSMVSGYAIDYCAEKECFVIAVGNAGMLYVDDALKKAQGSVQPLDFTWVTQGICADEQYIYHVLCADDPESGRIKNIVFFFDWEGKLIAEVPIDLDGLESENISRVGDTFYIGCNDGKGGVIYTATLSDE